MITYLLLFANIAMASPKCDNASFARVHKIFCRIKVLQPKIADREAMVLSNHLYRYSRKFKMNPFLSVAISMQEMSLRMRNRYTNVLLDDNRIVSGITDIGYFQISVGTARDYKLDIERLKTDVEYQVATHFKILKDKIKVCSKPKYRKRLGIKHGDEWTCYHSFNKKHRLSYKRLVERYLPKRKVSYQEKKPVLQFPAGEGFVAL